MKHFISVLAIVFALASFGAENHKVYVHYGADAANTTNMMLQVTDGANFAFRGVLPAGYGISSFDYAGIPKQVSNHKSKLLFVGINDYLPSRGLNSLSSCLNDAETLANLLLEGGYFKGEDGVLLENANALTSVIRNQVRAAANQLVSGDLFVYYQSSHGGNSPYSLTTYDSRYTASDLASDLSYFQAGVKVVIILDACYSGAMIPQGAMAQAVMSELAEIRAKQLSISTAQAEADMKNDMTFLTASRGDEESYGGKALSVFTSGLFFGCDAMSDLNGDGMISFAELYVRGLAFLDHNNITRQHPYISNPELANNIQAFPIPQKSCFGRLIEQDGFCYFIIPCVKQELYIEIKTSMAQQSLLSVPKFSLKTNLKKAADMEDPLPNALNITLSITESKEKGAKQTFTPVIGDSAVTLNGAVIPLSQSGQVIKSNKKMTSASVSLLNYYFEPVGKFQYKFDQKKNKYTCKIKYSDECYLHTMFSMDSGSQNVSVILRDASTASSMMTADTVYKEGKSFTAKLAKAKK